MVQITPKISNVLMHYFKKVLQRKSFILFWILCYDDYWKELDILCYYIFGRLWKSVILHHKYLSTIY